MKNLCVESMIFFQTEGDETVEEALDRLHRLIRDLAFEMVITSVSEEVEESDKCETQNITETQQPEGL